LGGLGMCNAGKPYLGRLPPEDSVLLSGLFGESLRTNYPGTTRLRSKRAAARFPHNLQVGSAELLLPDAIAAYRAEMHDLLFERATTDDSPQDVIDTFYLRQRLRHWLGNTIEIDSEARAFPLYSLTGMRLAFAIGAETRHAEWIHYHLMRATCEPLVNVPFASGRWDPRCSNEPVAPVRDRDEVPDRPLPRPAGIVHDRLTNLRRRVSPSASTGTRSAVSEYRASVRDDDVEIMRRLFRHDSANPAFQLIDSNAALRAVDRFDDLSDAQQTQVYGALTVVIWLGGHEVALPHELSVR